MDPLAGKMSVVDCTTWYVFVAVENEYCTSYSYCKSRKSFRLAKIWDKKEIQFVGISELTERVEQNLVRLTPEYDMSNQSTQL